ncbi:MAG: transporter periplasmic subunit [Evtepia sp.]|nr:transporter periplasmic subunit [Evtepia sp.]
MLLETQGIIKLKEGVGLKATKLDIAESPLNIEIVEMEAAQLPGALSSVDMAVINGNYAIGAGLSVSKNAVATEDANSDAAKLYANILVVKEGNENNEAVQALVKALKSEKVRDFMNEKYDGAVVPLF